MIEMQYNFPLLPGLAAEWRERLLRAVEGLPGGGTGAGRAGSLDIDSGMAELRPTFRSDRTAARALAAAWLGTTPERVWITEGGHHGSLIAFMAARVAARTVALDDVTYTGALEQVRALGCGVAGVKSDAEGMRADSLQEACLAAANRGAHIAAVYTLPTVHNPLGVTAGEQRRREVVEVAREFDLLIVEDGAYAFMEENPPPSYAVLAPERTFYVQGLSKSYAPATRTGFLVAPVCFTAAIESALKNTATGTSLVHNEAALSLIADGTLDRVMERKRVEGARRNAAARELLGEFAAPGARCAWHLWVRLPEQVAASDFERRMAERGVAVSGGNWFETVPGAGRGVRVALGGEVDPERTQAGVRLVAEELHSR
jgi:DNA-binding transcriptional MocR family regulator